MDSARKVSIAEAQEGAKLDMVAVVERDELRRGGE